MDPIVIVVIVVVLLGAVAFIALRRGADRTLPPEKRERELPAGREAAKKVEVREKPAVEAKPARERPAERAAEPTPPPRTAPVEAPERPAGPSKEEVRELQKGLKSTRGGFIARLAKIFGKQKEIDPALLEEIEEVLITADIGVRTTEKILSRLRERLERNELGDADRVWEAIREEALAILGGSRGGVTIDRSPTVLLVVGVNGVGKTTTIGKLASRLQSEGKKAILGAGDTFRAAAVLQLEVWGRRVGCSVVKGKERADPASVIFDAVKKATDGGADVVIADTAGRLHTKTPLMEELKKAHRTVEKALGRPADEVLLVLDATNGQNAIQQAAMFKEALPITGIVLTKLDGTAKGGVILGIVDEQGIPVRYIGIGERVEDLREFDAASFVAALFAKPDDESMAA
jgi:fused signal recognition particle receptor